MSAKSLFTFGMISMVVAVFVGKAWDPQEGRETPWIDLARQFAGDAGVKVVRSVVLGSGPALAHLH